MKELANDKQVTQFIISLNTNEQLFDEGIDSTGKSLASIRNGYSPKTIKIKREKGQPIDRITLRDTGAFHESWKVFLDNNFDFEITNNPIKDTTNLLEEWGKNVIGLTEESQARFNEMVARKVQDIVRKLIIKQAA